MANTYLQFSECMEIDTDEAAAWIEVQLDLNRLQEKRPGKYAWKRDECDLETPSNGFGWVIETDKMGKRQLWLYADENGNPASVARFVQAYLRQFLPDQVWSLTYAVTCSKPRMGEFSGGAIVVTATEIEILDAADLACESSERKQRWQKWSQGPAAKVALAAAANNALDEAVHEAKAAEAAAINNRGPADQWAFLLEAWGQDEIGRFLDQRNREEA